VTRILEVLEAEAANQAAEVHLQLANRMKVTIPVVVDQKVAALITLEAVLITVEQVAEALLLVAKKVTKAIRAAKEVLIQLHQAVTDRSR
jgi:hypothetical protein